jgi:trehalose 6-phosphate phosphatase
VWAPFLEDPQRAAIVTDFDGTLAPIVDDPSESRPLPGAVDVLHRLSHRYARVGVVSGRPAGFIVEHLRAAVDGSDEPGRREESGQCEESGDCNGVVVSGLYGLEKAQVSRTRIPGTQNPGAQNPGAQGGEVTPHPDAEGWREVVDDVVAAAEENAPDGVVVEGKGLSVTIHYRGAQEHEGWVKEWAEERARATGLSAHPARMSYELRLPIESDKGSALTELVSGLSIACFAGDDSGDLPAFEALDRLARDEGMMVLKVAVRSDESPPELLERADVEVDGPEGMVELFKGLL